MMADENNNVESPVVGGADTAPTVAGETQSTTSGDANPPREGRGGGGGRGRGGNSGGTMAVKS
jgi:hypothetical protein